MVNLDIVNKTIKEIEAGDTNFVNCQSLAILYIVREYASSCNNETEEELYDILPQYKNYCQVKRSYQLGEIPKEPMLKALNNLCKEIREFIETLNSNTNTPEERDLIKQMINTLK
mgnify:CR=1 FL=1